MIKVRLNMKIIVDCFGGDNSPFVQVKGAINVISKTKEFSIVLVGKANEINSELAKYEFDESRIEVLNADEVISCDDKPTSAIKEKVNSSLVVSLDLLKHDSDCKALVSAGSTGAILVGSVMKIGRIKGISRPSLTPLLPSAVKNKRVMLVDCGANAECKAVNLLHFALMGSVYFREILGVNKPKVAILCNGTEEEKGTELTKEAFQLVKTMPNIDFKGYCEGRDIFTGEYDVIVTDGFSGNIALKTAEGSINLCFKVLKNEIKSSFISKIGALLSKKSFKNVKKSLDYNSFGGAVVLGADMPIIKAHGSSSELAIECAIYQAYDVVKNDIVGKIKQGLVDIGSGNNV